MTEIYLSIFLSITSPAISVYEMQTMAECRELGEQKIIGTKLIYSCEGF